MVHFNPLLLASLTSLALILPYGSTSPVPEEAITDIESRQSKGLFTVFLTKEFAQIFPQEDTCCDGYSDECRIWSPNDGDHWMMCGIPGDYEITQDDANAIKCLSNKHFVQPSTCIDVAPDACGYGAGKVSGEITSAHLTGELVVGANGGSLTQDVDRTIQRGADGIVGIKLKTRDHDAFRIVDASALPWFGSGLTFFGQRGKSC